MTFQSTYQSHIVFRNQPNKMYIVYVWRLFGNASLKDIGKQHKLKHILQVIDLKTQYTKDVIFLQTDPYVRGNYQQNPNSLFLWTLTNSILYEWESFKENKLKKYLDKNNMIRLTYQGSTYKALKVITVLD